MCVCVNSVLLTSVEGSGDDLSLHVLAEHLQRNTAGKRKKRPWSQPLVLLIS